MTPMPAPMPVGLIFAIFSCVLVTIFLIAILIPSAVKTNNLKREHEYLKEDFSESLNELYRELSRFRDIMNEQEILLQGKIRDHFNNQRLQLTNVRATINSLHIKHFNKPAGEREAKQPSVPAGIPVAKSSSQSDSKSANQTISLSPKGVAIRRDAITGNGCNMTHCHSCMLRRLKGELKPPVREIDNQREYWDDRLKTWLPIDDPLKTFQWNPGTSTWELRPNTQKTPRVQLYEAAMHHIHHVQVSAEATKPEVETTIKPVKQEKSNVS